MSNAGKRLLVVSLLVVATAIVLLFVASGIFVRSFEPELRRQAIRYLEQRFQSQVSLADLRIGVPSVSPVGLFLRGGRGTVAHVKGRSLTLRYHGMTDVPPLFSADTFSFDLDLGMLRQSAPRIPLVTLRGLTIVLPPRTNGPQPEKGKAISRVVIDTLNISDARLIILPKRTDAKPLDFAIGKIRLASAGVGQQMKYQATLANAKPPGQIQSQGTFGPWDGDNPGGTPLEGDFDFSNADLSVFKAIAGILHSHGHFLGTLSAVRARGEATVPDFRLKSSGNPIPLETQYDVIVDGMNGNTILQPVHARLRNTAFETSGAIIKHEEQGRRSIDLDVRMPQGHIEDLLLLAVKGKPFMSGLIGMKAKISIPPLSGTVKENLLLTGDFDIARGEFLRDSVQDKIDELSRRGQGRPSDKGIDNVFSRMTGDFRLVDQVLTFSRLSFSVPGADVGIHGDYRLADDILDFHGDLKLQAKISETLDGWKRWLAKPLDPFFAKHGAGTFLRIQVVGSAKKPEFGRDRGTR